MDRSTYLLLPSGTLGVSGEDVVELKYPFRVGKDDCMDGDRCE